MAPNLNSTYELALVSHYFTLPKTSPVRARSAVQGNSVSAGYLFAADGYLALVAPAAKTCAMMLAGLALVGFMARRSARIPVWPASCPAPAAFARKPFSLVDSPARAAGLRRFQVRTPCVR